MGPSPTWAAGSPDPPDPTAVLADLLLEHDRAACLGAPLLTDAGLAHVQRLLMDWASAPDTPVPVPVRGGGPPL